MLKIPIEDMIAKIKEKEGLSEDDINKKIDAKLEQLSGLVSREGAAHIIANELGIKLIDEIGGKLQIKNILCGMRSVETVGKVQAVYEVREFQTGERQGKVGSMVIGDETGVIRVVCWGDMADHVRRIKEGDIIKVKNGYVKDNQGRKEVHLNDNAGMLINPPGITVGEVKSVPDSLKKKINELREGDNNVELLGTIVQVFEPRFFELCQQCGRRIRQEEQGFICSTHGKVEPGYGYLVNVYLDDGTDSIRAVFFRNQAEKLLGKNGEEVLSYKDNLEKFESVKTELLGNIIKVIGKVNKNEMFDRIEFVAQSVVNNPDPDEEMKKLDKEVEKAKEEVKNQETSEVEEVV